MHIEEIIQKIVPADRGCMKLAQTRFDNLIKPVRPVWPSGRNDLALLRYQGHLEKMRI